MRKNGRKHRDDEDTEETLFVDDFSCIVQAKLM